MSMSRANHVGSHKTTICTENGMTHVQYHATRVVSFGQYSIILHSGGYRTNTTKLRMNQASNQFGLGFQVYQKAHQWFVKKPDGEEVAFEDGMALDRY
jgi:hypothetical protein